MVVISDSECVDILSNLKGESGDERSKAVAELGYLNRKMPFDVWFDI